MSYGRIGTEEGRDTHGRGIMAAVLGVQDRSFAAVVVVHRFPPPSVSPLRTFIVEDNKVIYDNLVSTLQELANVEVIGHARNEIDAVNWLQQDGSNEGVDLMIVDIFLHTGSGLGVLKAAQDAHLRGRRVVLTNYATPDIRQRCTQLGADRVFDKSCELDDLITYCERISDGTATAPGDLL